MGGGGSPIEDTWFESCGYGSKPRLGQLQVTLVASPRNHSYRTLILFDFSLSEVDYAANLAFYFDLPFFLDRLHADALDELMEQLDGFASSMMLIRAPGSPTCSLASPAIPVSKLDELLPWSWKAQTARLAA